MSIELTPEQEANADLIEDLLIDVAAELIVAVRDDGPDRIAAIQSQIPEGKDRVMQIVLAAMVNPDLGMRALLGWTDTMTPPPMRGRPGGIDPPGERERQRLIAEGVHPDTAIRLAVEYLEGHGSELAAAREKERAKKQRQRERKAAAQAEREQAVAAQPDTVRDRMLHIVRDGRRTA